MLNKLAKKIATGQIKPPAKATAQGNAAAGGKASAKPQTGMTVGGAKAPMPVVKKAPKLSIKRTPMKRTTSTGYMTR